MPTHDFAPYAETVLKLSSMQAIDNTAITNDISFIIGLLERSRRLLRAMLFLYQNDYGDCSEALCRSILEHCATGLWLLDDIEGRFEIALRAHLRELRILKDLGLQRALNSYQGLSELIRSRWGDATREAQLPPITQRLIGPMAKREFFYRELCARMHSSILSAAMGLIPVIDPKKSSHEIDSEFVKGYLPFATLMVWGLAIQLSSRLQLPVTEQLANIALIFEHWCKIDGQGAWSLR
jgi:hypothetical protein